ncbi:MAG: hypothetical protein DME26_11360 [Verrucomicrobia bacterium]|nr:MAG: hypothetical protein DME26_11360 [Verrucomicrobiota bacterium]
MRQHAVPEGWRSGLSRKGLGERSTSFTFLIPSSDHRSPVGHGFFPFESQGVQEQYSSPFAENTNRTNLFQREDPKRKGAKV